MARDGGNKGVNGSNKSDPWREALIMDEKVEKAAQAKFKADPTASTFNVNAEVNAQGEILAQARGDISAVLGANYKEVLDTSYTTDSEKIKGNIGVELKVGTKKPEAISFKERVTRLYVSDVAAQRAELNKMGVNDFAEKAKNTFADFIVAMNTLSTDGTGKDVLKFLSRHNTPATLEEPGEQNAVGLYKKYIANPYFPGDKNSLDGFIKAMTERGTNSNKEGVLKFLSSTKVDVKTGQLLAFALYDEYLKYPKQVGELITRFTVLDGKYGNVNEENGFPEKLLAAVRALEPALTNSRKFNEVVKSSKIKAKNNKPEKLDMKKFYAGMMEDKPADWKAYYADIDFIIGSSHGFYARLIGRLDIDNLTSSIETRDETHPLDTTEKHIKKVAKNKKLVEEGVGVKGKAAEVASAAVAPAAVAVVPVITPVVAKVQSRPSTPVAQISTTPRLSASTVASVTSHSSSSKSSKPSEPEMILPNAVPSSPRNSGAVATPRASAPAPVRRAPPPPPPAPRSPVKRYNTNLITPGPNLTQREILSLQDELTKLSMIKRADERTGSSELTAVGVDRLKVLEAWSETLRPSASATMAPPPPPPPPPAPTSAPKAPSAAAAKPADLLAEINARRDKGNEGLKKAVTKQHVDQVGKIVSKKPSQSIGSGIMNGGLFTKVNNHLAARESATTKSGKSNEGWEKQ